MQRLTALGDDRVELTRDPQARERRIGDQCQALARKIVDDGEDAETATVAQRVAIIAPLLTDPVKAVRIAAA